MPVIGGHHGAAVPRHHRYQYIRPRHDGADPSVYLAIRPPLRSCDGRIARCGVGQIVSGDLIKIGVAASLAKVKQLAERHAAEQRS